MQLSKNFQSKEFTLKSKTLTSLKVINHVQKIRDNCNFPAIIGGLYFSENGGVTRVGFSVRCGKYLSYEKHDILLQDIPIQGNAKEGPSESVLKLLSGTYPDSIAEALTFGELVALTAVLQAGFKEGKNNDNPFGAYFGFNNLPWCALFWHWCIEAASLATNKEVRRFVPAATNSLANLDTYGTAAKEFHEAVPGDGLIWSRTGKDNGAGHTGICVFNDIKNEIIYSAEGNSGDSVRIIKRPYDKMTLKGLYFKGCCRMWSPDSNTRSIYSGSGETDPGNYT